MSTTSTEKATGVRPIGEPHAGPPGMAGPLRITVVWGNIAEAQADLHVVGHYRGVMPSGTERVIDQAISPPGSDGIICRHARRRWLVGALGEVTYFPGPAGPATGNTVARVAVVGMGRVGTFGQENARTLFRTLLREVLELGDVRRLATVLIGSGADNLSIPGVAGGLVTGFADGLRATPGRTGSVVPEVLVVERDRLGAELALHALRQAAGREPAIAVSPDIVPGSGGQVSAAAAAVYGIRGLLERLSAELSAPAGDGARGAIPGAIPDELRDQVSARLAEIARRPADVIGIALQGADSAPHLPRRSLFPFGSPPKAARTASSGPPSPVGPPSPNGRCGSTRHSWRSSYGGSPRPLRTTSGISPPSSAATSSRWTSSVISTGRPH